MYLLSKAQTPDRATLPERTGRIGLTEYVCPQPPSLPAQIVSRAQAAYCAGQPMLIGADVLDTQPPQSVTLHAR